jgi:hypothetical protein
MLRVVCCIPRCPCLAPGRRGLLCAEHMAMVEPGDQQRLAALWKDFRKTRRRDAYLLWHGHAAACIAYVLVSIWEGVFTIPLGAHYCHIYGPRCGCGLPSPCPCPICVEARAVAEHLPSRRRYYNPQVIHGAARAAG